MRATNASIVAPVTVTARVAGSPRICVMGVVIGSPRAARSGGPLQRFRGCGGSGQWSRRSSSLVRPREVVLEQPSGVLGHAHALAPPPRVTPAAVTVAEPAAV